MSSISEFLSSKSKEEAFLVRSICTVGATIYPCWSFVYQYILPGSNDPVQQRLLVSLFALLIIVATFIEGLKRHVVYLTYGVMFFATAQLLWISYRNGFHPYYQLGCIVLFCASLPFYQSMLSLGIYMGATSALLILPAFFFELKSLLILYAACSTVFFVSMAALFTRLHLIRKLRKSREQIVAAADRLETVNHDISSIMQNIRQGIFTIESNEGHIGDQHSDFLQEIFRFKPKQGTQFIELFENSDVTADRKAQMLAAVSCIDEDELQFQLNAHLLPLGCQLLNDGSPPRAIELDWSPIINQKQGVLKKILVSVRDVTELRQLQAQNKDKQDELRHISEIISIDKGKMSSIFESMRKLLAGIETTVDDSDTLDQPQLQRIYREIHTLKGLARTYHLSSLANSAHQAEDQLTQYKNSNHVYAAAQIEELVQPVATAFRAYAEIILQKLGYSFQNETRFVLDRNDILPLIEQISLAADHDAEYHKAVHRMTNFLLARVRHPLGSVLEDLIASLGDLAQQLQKPVPKVIIHDPGYSFVPSCRELLVSVFTHLLRNAIDHGIEAPSERLIKGKSLEGHISIDLLDQGSHLLIYVRDDGCGLNLRSIKEKALKNGLIAPGTEPPVSTLANLIFLPDFTTKDKVTSVSGRGVGMDAVKSYLQTFHCTIELELLDASSHYSPFQFKITVPNDLFESFAVA